MDNRAGVIRYVILASRRRENKCCVEFFFPAAFEMRLLYNYARALMPVGNSAFVPPFIYRVRTHKLRFTPLTDRPTDSHCSSIKFEG